MTYLLVDAREEEPESEDAMNSKDQRISRRKETAYEALLEASMAMKGVAEKCKEDNQEIREKNSKRIDLIPCSINQK